MFLINENIKTVQKDYQASDTLIQLIFYGLEYLELEDFDLKTILAWIKLSLCLYPHHTPQKLGELITQRYALIASKSFNIVWIGKKKDL